VPDKLLFIFIVLLLGLCKRWQLLLLFSYRLLLCNINWGCDSVVEYNS